MKKISIFLFALLLTAVMGCAQSLSANKNPAWINNLITTFEEQPVSNPGQAIWQYQYKGQTVYYTPSQCCDQFSDLYDAKGNLIGHPDGGMTGDGDGKYTDFFQVRKQEKLIWQDPRGR
jgi:hypothetical protein